jgi:hypothetical protein
MSFDLKIKNGDFVIGNNGDVDTVSNSEKLIQDILKILMTQSGTNKFHLWYGSLLSSNMVGQSFDKVFVSSFIENQIISSLNILQKLQKEQYGKGQKVTPNELLGAIRNVSVIRDSIDPTKFNISVNVVTKGFLSTSANLQVTM